MYEDSEVGDLGDFAVDGASGCKPFGDIGFPGVFFELFESECDASSFLIDGEYLAGDCVAFFENFTGVTDLACPGHVADMEQSIDSFFEFHEGSVVGEISDGALDGGFRWVLGGDVVPRVGSSLFHTQRDFLLLLVDPKHNDFDFVADIDEFGRVIDAFGPGHFANMNQAFDPVFEFDEGPVGHHVDHFAIDSRIDGELGVDILPRAGSLLLESEGDFFFFAIDVEDHDLDLFFDFDHVRRVIDPSPAHIGDVQQAVDAS